MDWEIGKTLIEIEIMDKNYIKALGNLLATYESDLTYIKKFKEYKENPVNVKSYVEKGDGTFKSFINEFRVARNIQKGKTQELLNSTLEFINQEDENNVDLLANKIKKSGITHGKIMTSLASKILFLNNPYNVLPIDNLAKKAIGLKTNHYKDYIPLLENFRQQQNILINKHLKTVESHLMVIEKDFITALPNLEIIRMNRYVDKLLWTFGR